jgi:multidrug efflux pump subunit AcrA (membrane-fusion protein)
MPYQAQLDQVVAAKARDEALLTTARLDLTRYEKLVAQGVATVKNDQAQIEAEMPSCRAGRIAGRVGSYVDDNAVPRPTRFTARRARCRFCRDGCAACRKRSLNA